MSLTIIDKRGDVILILGIEEDDESRLLVSSRVLSLASPVFEAMFNSGFTESQDLSSESPREVPLPEDDPECTLKFCLIIHLQNSNSETDVDMDFLAKFALFCHKYACASAVQLWWNLWIQHFLQSPNKNELEKLLFPTYVLDLAKEFYEVTVSIIRYRKFEYDMEMASNGLDFIPLKVFTQLNTCQRYYHHQMSTVAHKCFPFEHTDSSRTKACVYSLRSCFAAFDKIKAWQCCTMSIQTYRDVATSLSIKSSSLETTGKDNCTHSCRSNLKMVQFRLVHELDRLIESIQGVCLDCVNRSTGRVEGSICRVSHTPLKWLPQ